MEQKTETVFGIVQPFRKLCVLLTIGLIWNTTILSFEFAIAALNASEALYLQVVGVITIIQGLVTYLAKNTIDDYWKGRK